MKCSAGLECFLSEREIKTEDDIIYISAFRTKWPCLISDVMVNLIQRENWKVYHADCARELGIKMEEG